MQATKVQNTDRMMTSAEVSHLGLSVAFADGVAALVPWERVEKVGGLPEVASVSLDTPYLALARTVGGETVEIPWDFARHFGDPDYRKRMDDLALRGQRKFAMRLRDRRRGAGLSQRQLAEMSGVGKATVARLETAAQSPRLETIRRLAAALDSPIHALLTDMDDAPSTA